MEKNKTIEMKIYELLGVKTFRKIVFGLRDASSYVFVPKMSKEERHEFLYNRSSNYNLGKVQSLEDVKRFKKKIFINTGIHVGALLLCMPDFWGLITGTSSLSLPTAIVNYVCVGINLYCIMLQRYNCIRINRFVKKMTPYYEKQKADIKEELKKDDSLLKEHTYKLVDKKEKSKTVNFDEIINNATLNQLKEYRKNLKYIQQYQVRRMYDYETIVSRDKGKTLKIDFENNTHEFTNQHEEEKGPTLTRKK